LLKNIANGQINRFETYFFQNSQPCFKFGCRYACSTAAMASNHGSPGGQRGSVWWSSPSLSKNSPLGAGFATC